MIAGHATEQPGAWTPDSWRTLPVVGMPRYSDPLAVSAASKQLALLPPLVTSWEILSLRRHIAEAQREHRFLLLGGDSMERFAVCESGVLSNRLKVLLQISLLLAHGLKKPVVRIGNFAGQYARICRDTRDDVACHGDIVTEPGTHDPNPNQMLIAHVHSALTMNFIRALIDGGFTDIDELANWKLAWTEQSSVSSEFRSPVEALQDALQFIGAWSGRELNESGRAEMYYSHDALLLPYEESCTRQVPRHPGWFNLSTHLPRLDIEAVGQHGAHVEYLRGLNNPIAIEIGPDLGHDNLLGLINTLNPGNEAGRIVLIYRLGLSRIADVLPRLLAAVHHAGRRVLWVCDPMSGNSVTTGDGQVTRSFDEIQRELARAFELHAIAGTPLGGVHLDLTGEDVSECVEGACPSSTPLLTDLPMPLPLPRLNYRQSIETVMFIVRRHLEWGAGIEPH